MHSSFRNRTEAGELLATKLTRYAGRPGVVVLGLPRGGVPVAAAVAEALNVPLDVLPVRKLGVPGQEELAMGAIASGGATVLNDGIIRSLDLSPDAIARTTARETAELARRERAYRGGRTPCVLEDRTAILVDDGIATGATVRAALTALRRRRAARVVIAAPVIAQDAYQALCGEADEVTAVVVSAQFRSVGEWYDDFAQTTDEEVRAALQRAPREGHGNFVA